MRRLPYAGRIPNLEPPTISDAVRIYIVDPDGLYTARDVTNEALDDCVGVLDLVISSHRHEAGELRSRLEREGSNTE